MEDEFKRVKEMKKVTTEIIQKLLDDICQAALSEVYDYVYKSYSNIIENRKHYLNDQHFEIIHYIFVSSSHKVIKISYKYDTESVGNSSPVHWCYKAQNIEVTNIEGFNFETSNNLKDAIEKILKEEYQDSIARTIWHD